MLISVNQIILTECNSGSYKCQILILHSPPISFLDDKVNICCFNNFFLYLVFHNNKCF